jgi:hypothetical protein
MPNVKPAEKNISITVPLVIALTSAFDSMYGGCNYWMSISKVEYAAGKSKDDYEYPSIQAVLDGGKVTIHDQEDNKKLTLTYDKLIKGLEVMANLKAGEGGHHFPNFMAENDDAETADVFVQCCLFGKIVYG